MNALKNLQDKIAALETDRIKAENNMKTLANETKEYKELLSQQHAITPVSDHGKKTTYRRRSHSDGTMNFRFVYSTHFTLFCYDSSMNNKSDIFIRNLFPIKADVQPDSIRERERESDNYMTLVINC